MQVAPGIFIQIDQGATYTISLPQSGQINVSANAQMTFIWSGLNNGTFYDASTLIEANKINIQREAAHRIYDKYPKFTYPRVPEAAYRFKDGRRLIYDNLQDTSFDRFQNQIVLLCTLEYQFQCLFFQSF